LQVGHLTGRVAINDYDFGPTTGRKPSNP